ncbi:trafficking protein particle complex subunit 12-like [Tubulanus polymorphus]|uniref:trafficking protein particle complex subunit 12-like n=1 Tax=Tubulanus polymorphus TaxID=672921 RepID=UPI003DA5C318
MSDPDTPQQEEAALEVSNSSTQEVAVTPDDDDEVILDRSETMKKSPEQEETPQYDVSGSLDYLDTIGLETSPTMESLDLDRVSTDVDLGSLRDNLNITEKEESEDDEKSKQAAIELTKEEQPQQPYAEGSNEGRGGLLMKDDAMDVSIIVEELEEQPSENELAGVKRENIDGNESNIGISSYFQEPKEINPDDASAFFDSLSTNETEEFTVQKSRSHSGSFGSDNSHHRTRTISGSVQTVEATFEGENVENVKDEDSNSVSLLFTDEEVNACPDKEGKEIFEHFTAEVEEPEDLKDDNDSSLQNSDNNLQLPESATVSNEETSTVRKTSSGGPYILPHLSPGPSPNTSAYASPIHHVQTISSNNTPQNKPDDLKQAVNNSLLATNNSGPFSAQISDPGDDDPFSTSLQMSEADRRQDAWIPSDATRQTIVAILASTQGNYFARSDQLTLPGLTSNEPQGDPVRDLMVKCFGEQEAVKRQCLGPDDVSPNEEGLRQLIRADSLRSAVDLTGHLLTNLGQGIGKLGHQPNKNTPETLQLWFTRIALLVKLKQYTHAEAETQAFGNFDKPDLYYEFYPDQYPGRKGCMVPFSFRVLHAELPHFHGKSQDTLDRLYYVYTIVKKILSNLENGFAEDGSVIDLSPENRKASQQVWEKREVQVLYSILNVLGSIKAFDNAVDILEQLIVKDAANRIILWSALGRLYVQMGDVISGKEYFNKVLEDPDDSDKKRCQVHMNKGFLSLGLNEFENAKSHFKAVIEIDPSCAVAVNNMAVCCLYMGKLKEALSVLENLIHRNPGRYLQEGVLINLCTLYELESSHALQKKQGLLELVSKHKGNGFNTHCLKMGEILTKK